LLKYYNLTSDFYTCATVLDPRIKLGPYENGDGQESESKDHMKKLVNHIFKTDYLPDQLDAKTTDPIVPPLETNIFASLAKKPRFENIVPKSELDTYLAEPVVDVEPLEYWKVNSKRFPYLSQMARDYLGAMATSTPSERAFSKGRHIVTDFRCSMNGDTVEALALNQDWIPKLTLH
jgi:hypothetical protein